MVAEGIARHDPGAAPRRDLGIVPPATGVPLAEGDRVLLRRTFYDCTRIELACLDGGLSDARVFIVHATMAGSQPGVRPQPMFAKIDRADKIDREHFNYRTYAERYLPFGLRPNIKRPPVTGNGRSVLVGDFVARSESLWQVIRRHGAASVLSSLFDETLAGWLDQGYCADEAEGPVCIAMSRAGMVRPDRIDARYADWSECVTPPAGLWSDLSSIVHRHRLAPAHGDLHVDNVRVLNGQAILIDMASVTDKAPTTADAATLEASLAFRVHEDVSSGEFNDPDWRREIDRLFDPTAFGRLPAPCDRTEPLACISDAARAVRRIGLGMQTSPGEYQAAMATVLLRRCEFADGSPAELGRRAAGYAAAAALIADLKGHSA